MHPVMRHIFANTLHCFLASFLHYVLEKPNKKCLQLLAFSNSEGYLPRPIFFSLLRHSREKFLNFNFRDEVAPVVVEKPKKKSRRKVSKEGSTEEQPNPGVGFLTDYFENKVLQKY